MNFFQKVETPPITLISYNEPVRFTRVNYWQASYIFTRSILFLKMGPTRELLLQRRAVKGKESASAEREARAKEASK